MTIWQDLFLVVLDRQSILDYFSFVLLQNQNIKNLFKKPFASCWNKDVLGKYAFLKTLSPITPHFLLLYVSKLTWTSHCIIWHIRYFILQCFPENLINDFFLQILTNKRMAMKLGRKSTCSFLCYALFKPSRLA